MNFRAAQGKRIDWLDTGVENNFSNFLFIDQRYDSDPVMRRIFSLARKLNYKSLLIEKIDEADCNLLAEENAALQLRRSDFLSSEVHRISFFRNSVDSSQFDFCGYVVFKRDRFSGTPVLATHVYESVMKPPRQEHENNFIHCKQTYSVNTTLGQFSISGVLYAQQNDLTFVCAHVGLRSVLSCVLPEGDISYAHINALAGIDHKTRVLGGGLGGMGPDDFERVFNGLNIHFTKLVHEPKQQLILPTDFQQELYGFIESGYPALMGFELDVPTPGPDGQPRHAIPVFGHTFNEDTWIPDAQRNYFSKRHGYYPSENWLSTFIVHDDNFGPYFCLPRNFLKKDNFRIIYGLKPENTPLSAVEAEAIGYSFFDALAKNIPPRGVDWYDRFVIFSQHGLLVLRSLLVRKNVYLAHLASIRTQSGAAIETEVIDSFRNCLPEYFWMIEASAPELFAYSRRKFGEVLLVADQAKPLNSSAMIAARLPGLVVIQNNQQFDVRTSAVKGHTPLFCAK